MENQNKFIQGYVCAVVCLINSHGCTSEAKDVLSCGIGNRTAQGLIDCGVEQSDIDILLEHNLI